MCDLSGKLFIKGIKLGLSLYFQHLEADTGALFEFQVSLVYIVSSRTAKDTKRDLVSKNQNQNQNNISKQKTKQQTKPSSVFHFNLL